MRRSLLAIALSILLIVPAVAAQRPLVVPNYYVSQLPLLESGVPASGELTELDGQSFKDGARVDLYQFVGEAGMFVDVNLTSPDFDTYLSVFGPSGRLLASNDDADSFYEDRYASEVYLELEESGRHLVVVSAYSQYGLGAYELLLTAEDALDLAGAVPVDVPSSLEDTLSTGAGRVPGGWTGPGKGYRFELADPVAVKIDASSLDFDTYLYLLDESGRIIASNDDLDFSEATGYSTDSRLFQLLEPGSYAVYVSSWSDAGGGEFTLSFEEFVPRE